MSPFYACPKCKKEISSVIDTAGSAMFTGWGAFMKEECQFCGTGVTVNWVHYLLSLLLSIVVVYICYVVGSSIFKETTKDQETLIGLIMFATFLPVGMVLFYVVLPKIFGVLGLSFFKENK